MVDDYAATAATYDLLTAAFRPAQEEALAQLLAVIDPTVGPLLDIGCGSGHLLAHALQTVPDLHGLGLEPSPAMRALALARFAGLPALHARVTIRPEDTTSAPLPPRLSGALAFGVLGHLHPDQRPALFRALAPRLAGPFLFDLQAPDSPVAVPAYEFARARLGELTYRGTAAGTPVGPHTMEWTMTYETCAGETVIERATMRTQVEHPPPPTVLAELAAAGFTARQLAGSRCWLAAGPAGENR